MLLTSKARDSALPSAGPVSLHALRSWPTAAVIVNLILASLVVSVSASDAETALLPYIPTTVLIPGSSTRATNSTAYILTLNNARDSVDLLSLDISSSLASSSVDRAAETLTAGLPFLSSSSNTTSFTPTIAADGSILVYAGDCTSESSSGVWTYNTTSSDQASWKQHQVATDEAGGPCFLGEAMAFSEVTAPFFSAPQIYSYGGQCPNASVNGTTWVNMADYTNAMVRLTRSSDGYEAETISLKSQPIAEAGFSLTQLLPSTSNISGTVTQSLNSVVLGGHTQLAFVNMSTAAVWSLPEETWSFVAISGPSSSSSSDTSELAKNGETGQVQSRSGHTAVLNEAGTSLVIMGGWVGNTSQAAEPQLAVLEMNSSEFGEWTWSVPDNQPLTNGEGIYGHGAALLPGNVMMVVGGYALSSSSSSASSSGSRLGRRDGLGVAGGQLKMFLNLTSMSWTDSYTNPLSTSSGSGHTSSPSSTPTKLALGLGLGLGIPALLFLLAIAIFCVRRSQRTRHSGRDDHGRGFTSGAAFITSDEMLEAEHEHEYPWAPQGAGAARWYSYTGGHDPYLRDEKSLGYESLRGQRGVRHPDFGHDITEPRGGGGGGGGGGGAHRGSVRRKPAPRVAKGLYQPTGVDESRALAVISPILEDEEDELSMHGAISPDRDMEGNEDDPFVTPSHPTPEATRGVPAGPNERSTILFVAPSPSPGPPSPTDERTRTPTRILLQHPEVQDWVTDIDASDALITRRIQPHSTTVRTMGRSSPTRRTSVRVHEDDLSPGARTDSNLSESTRSAFSFMPNRSDSLRVGAFGAALLGVGNPEKRGGTSHSDNSSSSNTNSSYMTAKSIPTLQQEGPTLLLGRPRAISCIEDLANVSDDDPLSPGSPSKNKAPRRSWFGSLRRVFSGGHSSGSSAGTSSRTESPTHGETSDYDRLGLSSLGLGGVGLLQKRRQGRSAWDDHGAASGSGQDPSHGDGPGHGHGAGEGWDEEDWDIERAVEQRLVQVMFSVPKERLRIVNGEPDMISIEESVVVVDPEKDDADDDGDDEAEELSPILEEEKMVLGKGKEKAEEGKQAGADDGLPKTSDSVKQRRDDGGAETKDKGKAKQAEGQRQSLLLEVPQHANSEASESPRRSFSPGIPMTAEEVRFERPRTRVLDMVENIEERSRSNSPAKERVPLLKD